MTSRIGIVADKVDSVRKSANKQILASIRSELGQFMTPSDVAQFMASMLTTKRTEVRVLDPGAGVGSLTAAFVENALKRKLHKSIFVTAFEIDETLCNSLRENLLLCQEECKRQKVQFDFEVRNEDFVVSGIFASEEFECVIMNPPYRKINSNSEHRSLLRAQGIETSNLYTAFMAIGMKKLRQGGDMVAITPRSFCNGTYFRRFRKEFLSEMVFQRLHVYASRSEAFADDQVLQENIITHSCKSRTVAETVVVSTSSGKTIQERLVPYQSIVHSNDSEFFIRVLSDSSDDNVSSRISNLPCVLSDLGLEVSTGRVVDFRTKDNLLSDPDSQSVPLIYPCHLKQGRVSWPLVNCRKPNALRRNQDTESLLVEAGHYVLVKRFSAKEEKRRIVASVLSPTDTRGLPVGIENHLNFFHNEGGTLEPELALGLAVYLNSTIVDQFFRLFSGHTQVNSTDLRTIPYPSSKRLIAIGKRAKKSSSTSQEAIDATIEEMLFQN